MFQLLTKVWYSPINYWTRFFREVKIIFISVRSLSKSRYFYAKKLFHFREITATQWNQRNPLCAALLLAEIIKLYVKNIWPRTNKVTGVVKAFCNILKKWTILSAEQEYHFNYCLHRFCLPKFSVKHLIL